MAKDPKKGLSDADIVRLRDDAAFPDRAQALGSPEARRALAESRLRALAISLTGTGAAQTDDRIPNDDELLEYLLADVDEDRRRGLESRLRGNPRAFARLMKLHELTSAQVNRRDLQHVDMPERKTERHDLGKFDVRIRGGRLMFRRVEEQPPPLAQVRVESFLALRMPDAVASAVDDLDDDDTLGQIERLLFRCSDLAAQVRQLRDDGGRWDPDDLASLKSMGRLPEAEAELAETIRRLQVLGHNLERDAMISRKLGMPPKGRLGGMRASLSEFSTPREVKKNVVASSSATFGSERGADWKDKAEFTAGPWAVIVTGIAGPTLQIEVFVVNTGSHFEAPFLTMIQPGKTFGSADLDADGKAALPLASGRNVLLLQAAAVWAVQLELRSV